MNCLSVGFNDMFTDGESETGAALVAAAGCVGAIKSFKNPVQVFFFNTDTIVGDFNQYMFTIRSVDSCRDDTIDFSVFLRILDKI